MPEGMPSAGCVFLPLLCRVLAHMCLSKDALSTMSIGRVGKHRKEHAAQTWWHTEEKTLLNFPAG